MVKEKSAQFDNLPTSCTKAFPLDKPHHGVSQETMMRNDGKTLEHLVSFIEKQLLPPGCTVEVNKKLFDSGVPLAEFDIEIRGKLGSTDIAWLIECRDRTSDGPASAQWIEQLQGRRARFNFNKVTAVSTSGFAAGAVKYARQIGIELRHVNQISPEAFDWLRIRTIEHIERQCCLEHAKFNVSESTSAEEREALRIAIEAGNEILVRVQDRQRLTASQAFAAFVNGENLYAELESGVVRSDTYVVGYSDDDFFVVETMLGDIRIEQIEFTGDVSVVRISVPLVETAEYESEGKTISQIASFAPVDVFGEKIKLEMHKIAQTGETHVVVRVVG